MDPAHGVPVKIWLYPLPGGNVLYRSLSDSAAGKVSHALEQFEALDHRLQVLEDRKAVMALPNMAATVKQFHKNFKEFLRTLKSEIKHIHHDIKCKNKDESQLLKVLRRLREHPFAAETIERWVESREEEADTLKVADELSKPGQMWKAKCRVALVVEVNCGLPDGYSQLLDTTIRTCRENGDRGLNLDIKMSEDKCRPMKCMFNDQHKATIEQFSHCYQSVKSDDIQFVLAEKSMENDEADNTGPVFFEIHDKASRHERFTNTDLLPDGVSSAEVSNNMVRIEKNRKKTLFNVGLCND